MSESKKFFCIRGYMKSGTNWVCRLLKFHPDIDCVGEFHWETFFHALEAIVANIAPARQQSLENTVRPELESMIKRCLVRIAAESAILIGDRTPTTLAPVVLSDAPQIVIIRDFRDVIVSRMFHLYNHPRVTQVFNRFPEMQIRLERFQQNPWFFRDHSPELLANEEIVRDSAREWANHQQSDRDTVQSDRDLAVKFIRYEELHADFERQARSLFDFLDVPSEQLQFPAALRPGHANENPNQLNRKGLVGDWRHFMTEPARRWINQEAGQEMIRQGYIRSTNW